MCLRGWTGKSAVCLSQTTKFPNEDVITLTLEAAPARATSLKIRVPYWATAGAEVAINGRMIPVAATPATHMELTHPWKTGDVITIAMPLTLHLDLAPDDKRVQAAMYGPLVLAVRQGTEDLTVSMIYADSGPADSDDGDPMPKVDLSMAEQPQAASAAAVPSTAVCFEKVEGSRRFPLAFRTKGRGPLHTLVPLNQIMDERYSVYVRNVSLT